MTMPKSHNHSYPFVTGGFTHVGMRRDHNEDAFSINPDRRLFIVADGMGGHNSGEIASKMTIETIDNFFKAHEQDEEITWPYKYDRRLNFAQNMLKVGTMLANDRVWETSQRNDLYHGMGTTVVAVHLENRTAHIANVGDSRCYLCREGEIRQLSEDHSLLNDTLKRQKLTPEEIKNFPHKNVIMRALGIKDQVEVDLFQHEMRKGDTLLLCTDGLTDMISDQQILDVMFTTPDIKLAAKLLVREANHAGGNDNITTVLIQLP